LQLGHVTQVMPASGSFCGSHAGRIHLPSLYQGS